MTNEINEAEVIVREGDIMFDCPHCSKSLAVDPRGAGRIITCPDCQQQVQVPTMEEIEAGANDEAPAFIPEEPNAQVRWLTDALADSQARCAQLEATLEDVLSRRKRLEQVHAESRSIFMKIGAEIAVLQASLDRIVALLQDSHVNNNAEPGS